MNRAVGGFAADSMSENTIALWTGRIEESGYTAYFDAFEVSSQRIAAMAASRRGDYPNRCQSSQDFDEEGGGYCLLSGDCFRKDIALILLSRKVDQRPDGVARRFGEDHKPITR